jgi:2-C-methyl-D-erythritol 4-phosphate cytidylyltransferase
VSGPQDVGVVIAAGGAGTRVGGQELKQFRWVAGKPMLLHSLQRFQARADVALVVCVLPRAVAGDPPPWLFQCDTERMLVTAHCRIVLIHDAARPLVTDETIERVVAEARAGRGAVAALPVVDTLKRVDAHGRIGGTVGREGLWRAQTPQGFPREMIVRAHQRAMTLGLDATDDAALCEDDGADVVVVPGSERALKITEEADFARAEALKGLEA